MTAIRKATIAVVLALGCVALAGCGSSDSDAAGESEVVKTEAVSSSVDPQVMSSLDSMASILESLKSRVDDLEQKVGPFTSTLDPLSDQIDGLEARVDDAETCLSRIQQSWNSSSGFRIYC
jgi:tetrahydromethanopterin S-methyltransferase subunit B